MNNNNFDEDTTGSNASDSAARGETEVIDLADEDGDQRNQIVIFASSNKKEKSWVWEHFSKTEKKGEWSQLFHWETTTMKNIIVLWIGGSYMNSSTKCFACNWKILQNAATTQVAAFIIMN